MWAYSILSLMIHFIIIDKLCGRPLCRVITIMNKNILRLISSLTLSNNPLTYFIDSMSHIRQSQSALAAKVETLLKLAYLIGNRTPTLTYFVIPLSYLLTHSSSILPLPISLSVSLLFLAVSSPRSSI